MTAASYLNSLYLMWFAQPKCDRSLFRRIRKCKPLRIVEVGLGDGIRGYSAVMLAQRYTQARVSYCGIDVFEASQAEAPLTLKQAHHRLSQTGGQIRLLPGDAYSALARNANFLTGTDLLIIDDSIPPEELSQARSYLPRMLHPETLVAAYASTKRGRQLRWLKPASFSERGRDAA